jgi:hypothetical protein
LDEDRREKETAGQSCCCEVNCGFTLAGAKQLKGETPEAISEAGCEVRTNCKDRRLRCPFSSSSRTHSGVREKNELSVRRSEKEIDSSKFVKTGQTSGAKRFLK